MEVIDLHRYDLDCIADECVDRFDEASCGVGGGEESDQIDVIGEGGERERLGSNWRSWGMSGGESERSRSRSPERKDFSNLSDEEVKDLCDLTLVNENQIASVAPSDVGLVSEESVFRVGVGIRNLGNTCFLNSVLQCLVRTAPLRQGLCVINHCSPCPEEEFCLICFLLELVHRTYTSFDPIAPYGIADNLRYFSPDFVRHRQEDAHEFLQCLLDKLEKFPTFPLTQFSAPSNTNLVKQVFGGSLVSRLRCSECNHISCTPEDLIDFSLEIDNVDTLEGALDSFTKLEKIEDIKLTCDGCSEKVSMEKQFVVDQAPLVASFHLKRFKNDGITVEKIRKHIEFPVTINLHPYTVAHSEHREDLIYDLYAVIVHDGFSSVSGHYYSFVRTSPSSWHEFDDSAVTRVTESHVLSREAYILFYAKRGTSWFSQYSDLQSFCQSVAPKYSPNSVLEKANQSSESDSSTENLNVSDVQVNKELSEDSNLLKKHLDNADNDVDTEGSPLNVDVLMSDKDIETRKKADVNVNPFLNFDSCKDNDNSDRKEVETKGGSPCSPKQKIEATRVPTCAISSPTNEEYVASWSVLDEATKSLNCQAKHTTNTDRNTTKPAVASCHSYLNCSPEATKAPKPMQRKRSPESPVDDPRKKQVLKSLSRMNMPMTRAKKFLAAMNGSPHKKNKKSPVSLLNKLSPQTACRKNSNRVVSSSVRSAIFR